MAGVLHVSACAGLYSPGAPFGVDWMAKPLRVGDDKLQEVYRISSAEFSHDDLARFPFSHDYISIAHGKGVPAAAEAAQVRYGYSIWRLVLIDQPHAFVCGHFSH
jgi:hypothetical protein